MKKSLFAAAILLVLPGLAAADPLSYTWVDAALSRDSAEFVNGGNGYQLSGSYGFAGHFFVDASYAKNDYGDPAFPGLFFTKTDAEDKTRQLGAGLHYAVSDTTDFVARLNLSHYSIDSSVQAFYGIKSESGHDLGVGLRTLLSPQLELGVFLDHNTANFNLENPVIAKPDNQLSAGLRWHITSAFHVGLAYESSSSSAKQRTLLSAGWDF